MKLLAFLVILLPAFAFPAARVDGQIAGPAVGDPALLDACAVVRSRIVDGVMRQSGAVPADAVARIVREQLQDGSWADIDYASKVRSAWGPREHARRTCELACAWMSVKSHGRTVPPGDFERLTAAIHRAFAFWCVRRPVCPNWWYNQIGIPRTFGEAALVFRDELSTGEIDQIRKNILAQSRIGMTGQNRVWLAWNVLLDALLVDDERQALTARDAILGEVRVSDGPEGIQPDWSFHQHGAQPQFGNYGTSFLLDTARAADAFRKTAWAFPPAKLDILWNYYTNGLAWTVWNGSMDVGCLGRQFLPGAQREKASTVAFAASLLVSASGASAAVPPPIRDEVHFFSNSACAFYRSDGWMAAVKGSTTNIVGAELNVNGDGILAGNTADGALYVYRRGDEYEDVFPLWNWRHIPGITTYDLPEPSKTRNLGEAMVLRSGVELDIDHDGLKATKTYRFSTNGVACHVEIHATRDDTTPVITCLEQREKRGPLEILVEGRWVEVTAPRDIGSAHKIRHDGLEYEIQDFDGEVTVGVYHRKGSWNAFMKCCPPSLVREGDIVEIIARHRVQGGLRAKLSYTVRPVGPPSSAHGQEPADFVNPFIGTSGTGHTFPGACRPFGFVQPGPDTDGGTCGDWAHCSGYVREDRVFFGFAQDHLNGTGCGDLGDVLLVPIAREGDGGCGVPDRRTEAASPGYYTITGANGVRTEITCTPRVAFYRFSYPAGATAGFDVDLDHRIVFNANRPGPHRVEAAISADGRALEGHITSNEWAPGREVFFVVDCGHQSVRIVRTGTGNRYAVRWATSAPLTNLLVKVALSTVSIESARRSLAGNGLSGWNFDSTRVDARAEWNRLLGRIVFEASPAMKTNLYTALYHLLSQPNVISDAQGSYRGGDGKVASAPGESYSTFSTWDTYRAAHPLYTILVPERVSGFVDSMIRHQQATGVLPVWTLGGKETWCMIGRHSVPVVVDAVLKGFPVDATNAFLAVAATLFANVPATGPSAPHFDLYAKYGYLPYDFVKGEAVSRQMEDCYDAACAARLARYLGLADDFGFAARAASWTNIFDRATGFVRGRDSKGAWRAPFDPLAVGQNAWSSPDNDYTEGNAWQWTWHVLHDVDGLIAAHGGPQAFRARLDRFFTTTEPTRDGAAAPDVTGLIGQYAHGNEPSHHVAYLFALAGDARRTQELIREICETQYHPRPDGLCGNDDCGQMSAWYVFSCLGFYPVDPCSGEYVLGAPQVPHAVLHLAGGRTFKVIARNLSAINKHVRSVTLNGHPLGGPILRHADVIAGGELVFDMCP